jgi:putative membrane protein insertion efficiency factor
MTAPTASPSARRRSPLGAVLLVLVRGYQLVVSPWIPPRCRFYPSCSAYAVSALSTHGGLRGGWLAVRRLGRCHPWNPGGVDHVPGTEQAHAWASRQADSEPAPTCSGASSTRDRHPHDDVVA